VQARGAGKVPLGSERAMSLNRRLHPAMKKKNKTLKM
jgi:hypothetical protein